jgi:hypothetical protein
MTAMKANSVQCARFRRGIFMIEPQKKQPAILVQTRAAVESFLETAEYVSA